MVLVFQLVCIFISLHKFKNITFPESFQKLNDIFAVDNTFQSYTCLSEIKMLWDYFFVCLFKLYKPKGYEIRENLTLLKRNREGYLLQNKFPKCSQCSHHSIPCVMRDDVIRGHVPHMWTTMMQQTVDNHCFGLLSPYKKFQLCPNLTMKNTQIPLEGHSTKYLTSTPQNCQGHEKREKPEKMSQPRVV